MDRARLAEQAARIEENKKRLANLTGNTIENEENTELKKNTRFDYIFKFVLVGDAVML